MGFQMTLPDGYEIKELSHEEFSPLWDKHAVEIFDDNSQIFRLYTWLSDDEREKADELAKNMGRFYKLRLGAFYKGEFVGWAAGHQESSETYYMRNSAILPQHRKKGLYTALLTRTLEIVKEKGFQKIYSRHNSTNNNVIIPKLKVGFMITSLEITDTFGVLVHLTYFPKELRKKILDYRVGEIKPDEEIKKCLKI